MKAINPWPTVFFQDATTVFSKAFLANNAEMDMQFVWELALRSSAHKNRHKLSKTNLCLSLRAPDS